MKKQLPLLAALAVLGLAGPLSAETAKVDMQHCLATPATAGISDSCLALRAAFRVKVSACMTEHRVTAQGIHRATGSRTSHGYRALYLLCERDVRASLRLAQN